MLPQCRRLNALATIGLQIGAPSNPPQNQHSQPFSHASAPKKSAALGDRRESWEEITPPRSQRLSFDAVQSAAMAAGFLARTAPQ